MDQFIREINGPLCIFRLWCFKLTVPNRSPDKQQRGAPDKLQQYGMIPSED